MARRMHFSWTLGTSKQACANGRGPNVGGWEEWDKYPAKAPDDEPRENSTRSATRARTDGKQACRTWLCEQLACLVVHGVANSGGAVIAKGASIARPDNEERGVMR